MSGNTKIRGRQIETDDFIKSVRNADVDWTNDANTASQKAIAQLVGDSTEKFYGSAVGTAAVTTSGHRTSAIWDITDESVDSLYDGMPITVRVPVAGNSSYGTVIRFNGGDMHPVVFNVNSGISTRYGVGAFVVAHYDATQTATYYNNSNTAKTATGVWKVMDYDTTTTAAYSVRDYYFRPYAGAEPIYRYKLCAMGVDNRMVPITVTNQTSETLVDKAPTQVGFRPHKIWLYNTTGTVNAGAVFAAQTMYSVGYSSTGCLYNFNTDVPTYRLIFLRGKYNKKTDLFTLRKDAGSPCTSYYAVVPMNTANITLLDYFSAEDWYILVGCTYSTANYLCVFDNNPMYYFDGTNLIQGQTALNPTKVSELDNDAGYLTSADVVQDKNFVYEWSTPLSTITISHNLDKFPAVTIVDTAGNDIVGDVAYIDINTVTITFSAPTRGTAYFN